MEKKLAFVLGGGGSHGALQVGALRAVFEAGLSPDFLIGTSIGAVNAVFLAIHGFNPTALELLCQAWKFASQSDFMPANLVRLSVHALMERTNSVNQQRLQRFFAHYGLTATLRFSDLSGIPYYAVAADLNSGSVELYGTDPDQPVMEAVLASCALPPWLSPHIHQEKFIVDGAFSSNLPIEPAIRLGATELVAFSLVGAFLNGKKRPFLSRTIQSVIARQRELELLLAEARGVPVHLFELDPAGEYPLWDFTHAEDWMDRGYQITRDLLSDGQAARAIKHPDAMAASIN